MKFDFLLIFHWFSLLFRKFGCFKSYQWTSYLIEKVFTHTHTIYELSNLCKISIYMEFLCWLNFKLSFISLHIFEMLSDCFISWLYMRVLELILGKIFFLQIFLQSLFFSVKHSNSLSLRPDRCGSDGRTVKWHVWTCTALSHAYASGRVSDTSGRGPHMVKNHFLP
jgi:hypothetical protein